MKVEGTHGIADGTGGVGHFGVEDAFLADFQGIFVDDCLLAGDEESGRRTLSSPSAPRQ
jgi:hypothetical protein